MLKNYLTALEYFMLRSISQVIVGLLPVITLTRGNMTPINEFDCLWLALLDSISNGRDALAVNQVIQLCRMARRMF